MSQGLYLSQKMMLSQVLAPQLQQSLALLQAPTLELKALVEQELQQNPVLEELSPEVSAKEEADQESGLASRSLDPTEPPPDVQFDPATEKPSNAPVDDFQAEFERLSQMDQEWRDHFTQTNIPLRGSSEEDEKRQFMFDSLVAGVSLQENLLEQMRTSELPESDHPVAELIIGNIDDHGYLKASVEEMVAAGGASPEKIDEVLKVIQSFHPVGVGARDLRECLLIQLARQQLQNSLEYKIIDQHFDALGRRRIPEISKATGADLDDVQEALQRIARLNPRPGRDFAPEGDVYVVPEVFVTKSGDDYVVSTNNDHVPHLRISNAYKDLMSQSMASSEVKNYIRDKIRAGKFLIKSLHQRQQTILNIAKEIVARQRDFMGNGVSGLRPMTMSQVAEVVGVHETTVSRAVSGKYMETPQGVFEMKYFFTSGIQTSTGQGMSNTSVKEMIAEIFKKEDVTKPLSDDEVAGMLKEKGISIARRTVAKYRGELNILPSNLRKVY